MQCSTKVTENKRTNTRPENRLLQASNWEEITQVAGIDLEITAQEAHALQRVREIKTASDLLRLARLYPFAH